MTHIILAVDRLCAAQDTGQDKSLLDVEDLLGSVGLVQHDSTRKSADKSMSTNAAGTVAYVGRLQKQIRQPVQQ